VWIWSRGEELVTERFPEIVAAAQGLPDGSVLDGEVLAWLDGDERPAPFQRLQQRIARKTLTKKVLADAPVVFVAYDLLESDGEDRRALPQHERRARLEALLQGRPLRLSPVVAADDWSAFGALRATSRARGVEGFMLKHRDARYGTGRTKADGTWWKWKIDPLTVDGVLIYAQAGHGRRASVYTDYTFAVWNRPPADAAEAQAVVEAIARREPAQPGALQLVPFAKAYSGLSDEEFKDVDRVIRATTLEKFGPVRSVKPSLVFELGFEGIQASPRHKSGIAVRFPRMLRIRHDKPLHEADTLQTLQRLMALS
jgi:DNA ligase-1